MHWDLGLAWRSVMDRLSTVHQSDRHERSMMRFRVPYMSMRAKLLAFAFAVLLPIAGLIVYDFQRETQRHIDLTLDSDLQTARAVVLAAEAAFDGAAKVCEVVERMPAVRNLDRASASSLFVQIVRDYPRYGALLLYNREGEKVAAAFARDGEAPQTISDRPYFERALQTETPTMPEAPIERLMDRPFAMIITPVRDLEGHTVGLLLMGLDLDELGRQMADVAPRPKRDVFLADTTGRIGFHSGRPKLDWEEREASRWTPVAVAMRGDEVRMADVRSPFMGNTRATVAIRSPRYGWIAGVSQSQEILMAPLWDSLRERLLWFLATLGFASLLAVWLSGLLTRPLRELTSACTDVQRGYLGRRVDLRTGDEVEILAHAFNRTVEQMEQMTGERAEFDRLREEFVSMVAHDLRTPLTAIVGWADVLRRSLYDRPGLDLEQKAIQHLHSSARRLDVMVGDLLDASRIETRRLQLTKESIDLGELVPEVVERLTEVTQGRPVQIAESGVGLTVRADPRRIEQILGNLLSNAAKYGQCGTEINVRVWAQEGEVCCSVSNQGQGIAPQELRHVFERYYRGGRPRGAGGLGLGLYITRGLVEAHDGRIWVESEVGKTTTFTFCLPTAHP